MIRFLIIVIGIILLPSCSNKLSRDKAEELIKKEFDFPYVQTIGFALPRMVTAEENQLRKKLLEYNLIYIHTQYGFMGFNTDKYGFTDEGQKYVTAKNDFSLTQTHTVVSHCEKFGDVTGILMDPNGSSAKVDIFTNCIGVTPFGEYAGFKDGDSIKYSLTFQKYDDGWRLITTKHSETPPSQYSFFNERGEYIPPKISNSSQSISSNSGDITNNDSLPPIDMSKLDPDEYGD